jgi:hypothetical protein
VATTELADLTAEIVLLRQEVVALRAESGRRRHTLRATRTTGVRGRTKVVITALESDPDVQYRVHRWGAIYWLINFPIFAYLFFFARGFWDTTGVFVILIYSLYANLATDYGAMSAALAAKGIKQPPEIPLEP